MLAVMGIGFAWSGLMVLLVFLLYVLQGMLNIGYEYVLETGADGEEMWRVIPPDLDFALAASVLLTLALLYWRLRRKKQIYPGAFSLRPLRPYTKGLALVCLCYAARGLLYTMSGALGLPFGEGIGGALRNAAVMVLLALFSMLLCEGRSIGYLRGKGRNDGEIVDVIARATLVENILAGLLSVARAYLDGESIGVVSTEDVLALLNGIAFAVLCSRLYLVSGSMMGRGILHSVSWLFTVAETSYSIWLFVADAVLLIALCAAIRTVKEKTGRHENGLT
ncbi:MAG: hypothetical protein IJ313_07855 [Clostridia bacterium]|nr:hypothetical protein [Clostridia bacterium]